MILGDIPKRLDSYPDDTADLRGHEAALDEQDLASKQQLHSSLPGFVSSLPVCSYSDVKISDI